MMSYPKIDTVFKRDASMKKWNLLWGQFSKPEFEYLQNNEWIFTEKVDGTNIRIIFTPSSIIQFAGRTDKSKVPPDLNKKLQTMFHADNLAKVFDKTACLYGEGYGKTIQKNGPKYLPDDVDFVLFDVRTDGWWLKRQYVEEVGEKLGIKVVPIVGRGTLWDMVEMTKSGYTSTWGDFMAEGIVARPTVELQDRAGNRIITKIKYRDFER